MTESSVQTIDRFDGTEYAFLSNFYPAPFVYVGIIWPTSEHAYQAMKALPRHEHEAMAKHESPGLAKRMGRRLKLRPDWEEVKVEVMREIIEAKFRAHPTLAGRLLATGNAMLIEGNTWQDRFWGVYKGQGKNYLGILLMELRDKLAREIRCG